MVDDPDEPALHGTVVLAIVQAYGREAATVPRLTHLAVPRLGVR